VAQLLLHLLTYHLAHGTKQPFRHVELDIDIGADAKDWSAVQATEKLKPVETELRRIEEMVQEIVAEMDYLRSREQKLRDTNESTNNRVKWFAFGTMGMLVALGAWQVIYLRAYFRYGALETKCWNCLLIYTQIKASHLGYEMCEWRGIVGERFSAAMDQHVLLVAVENRYIMTIQRRARSALCASHTYSSRTLKDSRASSNKDNFSYDQLSTWPGEHNLLVNLGL
jgi:hypothetical protein